MTTVRQYALRVLTVVAVLVAAGAIFLVMIVPHFEITSGSMSKTIPGGSEVFVDTTAHYTVGDTITFHNPQGEFVTHDVYATTPSGAIRTKGNANQGPDEWVIHPKDVVGKVVVHVPMLGMLFDGKFWLFQLRQGYTPAGALLFVVAALLLWTDEDEKKNDETPATLKYPSAI